MDDKQLIEALKESKAWTAAVVILVDRGYREPGQADKQLAQWLPERSEESFTPEFADRLAAIRALLDEVKSGAIFGAPDKCAVCGHSGPVVSCWMEPDKKTITPTYWHRLCSPGTVEPSTEMCGLPTAAAILRARRLLGEAKATTSCRGCQAACEHAGSDWTGPCHAAEDHEAEVKTKQDRPVFPRPIPTVVDFDGTCWCCGREMEEHVVENDSDARAGGVASVLHCDHCGTHFVSDRIVYGGKRKAPPPPPPPTCWKCHRPNIIPAVIITSAPVGKRGDDERPLCYDCMRDNDRWHKEQDRLADVARDELDRPVKRGPYQPRMVGTGGFSPFDPRERR